MVTEPEEAPEEEVADGDDLDVALKQYDEATKDGPSASIDEAMERWRERAAPQEASEPEAPRNSAARDALRQLVESGQVDLRTCAQLEAAVNAQPALPDGLVQKLQAAEAAYQERIDKLDGDAAIAKVAGDTGLSDAEVRTWMVAEGARNPALQQAWNARHSGEEGARACEVAIAKAVKAMQADMARRPDREATESRMAVAAAVRSFGRRGAPAEDSAAFERRVREMGDQEFDAFIQGLD